MAKVYDSKSVKAIGTERKNYFDEIGKDVNTASNLEEAMELSGLNFMVKKVPIQIITEKLDIKTGDIKQVPKLFPNQYATVRTDTMEPLGIVGKNYNVLQNDEAFDFLDSMTLDAKFATAGSYGPSSAKSFITMSTEPMNILGDEFKPYILFMNSMDGSSSVRAMFTPIRVVCANCLARAIRNSSNRISIRHSSSLKDKLESAKTILMENSKYLEAVKIESERLATVKFTEDQFRNLLDKYFPKDPAGTDIHNLRADVMKAQAMKAYNQPDLENFNNTAYKAVQAIADYESHMPTFRETKTAQFKNITNVINGMPLTNLTAEIMNSL